MQEGEEGKTRWENSLALLDMLLLSYITVLQGNFSMNPANKCQI